MSSVTMACGAIASGKTRVVYLYCTINFACVNPNICEKKTVLLSFLSAIVREQGMPCSVSWVGQPPRAPDLKDPSIYMCSIYIKGPTINK